MLGSATGQDGDAPTPHRQITADSFRVLSARLSAQHRPPVVEEPVAQAAPPAIQAEPEQEAVAPEPVPAELPHESALPEEPAESPQSERSILERIRAENPYSPEDEPQAGLAVADTEILHDLVEAAEHVPAVEEPAEAEATAQDQPDEVETLEQAPAEPVIETEILHDLVEAAQPVEEEAVPEAEPVQAAATLIEEELPGAVDMPPPVETGVTEKPAAEAGAGQADERAPVAESRHWPDESDIVPDAASGQIARSLLDIMSMPQAGSLPQERALAADTLLRLIPRLPERSIVELVERVCVMEAPSQLLVRRLINDPRIEVAAPLLERGTVVNDRDLIAVIGENDPVKQRLIARRRGISPALAEALILGGDTETIVNLLRNGQASFSIEAFDRLLALAQRNPGLGVPLATRPDLPAPVAFELFWHLPAELRRYVLSRFLTDSETISKILKLSQVTANNAMSKPEDADLACLADVLTDGSGDEATQLVARLASISPVTAAKITGDHGKEPLTVAMKAAGLSRSQFEALMSRVLDKDESEPLKRIFDQLSFNKARVLLTYWDWAANRTGPYAKAA